jgi:uncharacterized protein with FMN-binding domain
MEPQSNLQKNIGIFLGVIIILGVFSVTMFSDKKSPDVSVTSQVIPDTTGIDNSVIPTPPVSKTSPVAPKSKTPPVVDKPKQPVSAYNNGTYSATGSYMSPGGYDQIGVSITIKNDIITATSATNMASDGRSQRYEDRFIAGYKQYVIGKNIASVNLGKISGSSLTPEGFNDALAQIKAQAKV